jgi:hypothetical protein
VLKAAQESCADASCPIEPMLDACVDWAVDRHWPSAVATFVPLLAVRDVQHCIRRGYCADLPLDAAP